MGYEETTSTISGMISLAFASDKVVNQGDPTHRAARDVEGAKLKERGIRGAGCV